MSKLTLNDLVNLQNEASAVASINSNSTAIETALENTLSRDGTSPNQMGSNLDMNSNRIINLPAPINNDEPLRLGDYLNSVSGVSLVGYARTADLITVNISGQYGVIGDGVVDYTSTIQTALTSLGSSGGGILYFPKGIYLVSKTLQVPSNVYVMGSGWQTIFRPPHSTITQTTIAGINFNAVFAAADANNIRFSDFYIDLRTNTTVCNGIQMNDHGTLGTVSDVIIQNVKITGNDAHQYLVYGVKTTNMTVQFCDIEGVPTAPSTQDINCIEFTGGTNVTAFNNNLRNAYSGVILRSDLASPSAVVGAKVCCNRIDSCVIGVTTSPTTNGGVYDTTIIGNVITNSKTSSGSAIKIELNASTITNGISICGNVLRESARSLINFYGNLSATVSNVIGFGNALYQTANNDSYVELFNAQNLIWNCNSHDGGGAFYGITISGSTNCRFIGNSITSSRRQAFQVENNSSHIVIEENTVRNSGTDLPSVTGLNVDTAVASSYIYVNRNTWKPNTVSSGYVINMSGCTSGGTAIDNNFDFIRTTQGICDFHSSVMASRQIDSAPANSSDYGERGDWVQSSSYRYQCSATNTWVRSAFSGGF